MPDNLKLVFRITRSQHMALLDIIMEHLRCENHTVDFHNCSVHPAEVTSIGDVLRIFSNVSETEVTR